MNIPASVLIAGSGWRVSRFIVPALLNEGVPTDRIVILRRSPADGAGILRNIRVVTSLDELSGFQCDLTINCVTAASLVSVQQALVGRFAGATHVCDTPIFERTEDLRHVLTIARGRVHSLEDWPAMPNLRFLADHARGCGEPGRLSVEHFGIPGHFLSLFRFLSRRSWPIGRALTGSDVSIVGQPLPGIVVSWTGPKQFMRAKVALRSRGSLIEDFHETESKPHDDAEVLYRVLDDTGVRYFRGPDEIGAYDVRPAILSTFGPFEDRKNVHELDKFIGVTRLLRHLLHRGGLAPYPYLSSVRDAMAARKLSQGKAAQLW